MDSHKEFGDLESIVVSCNDSEQIVPTTDKLMPCVPKQHRSSFNRIKLQILVEAGKEELHRQFNNRSVASILREYSDIDSDAISSGERDGLRWELHEPRQPSGED